MPGAKVAHHLRSAAVTVLGLILSFIPPALWVAWSERMLFGIMAVGVASAAALVLLTDYGPAEADDGQARETTRPRLSEQSIAELHRIFPLNYHHSMHEKTRFRQEMERIRKLLE